MVKIERLRETGAEGSEPDGISVVRRVLYIWVGNGNAVGIYQSTTKQKCQRVLARNVGATCRQERQKGVRGDVCVPEFREELSGDRSHPEEECSRV